MNEEMLDKVQAALQMWDESNLDCGSWADFRDERSVELAAAYSEGYTAGRDGEERMQAKFHAEDIERREEAWRGRARKSFDNGMQLGSKLNQSHARQVMATAVLGMLGKDAGDGVIDLGTLGRWFATPMGAVEEFGYTGEGLEA